MTRNRAMELISHEPTRLATFKKRKACILKKARELSVLCAVPVCVVVRDGHNDSKPEIWPEDSDQASEILSRFNSLSQFEKTRKMVDKAGFISQQIAKAKMQLQKIEGEKLHLEAQLLLRNVLSGSCSLADVKDIEMLHRLKRIADKRNMGADKRIEQLLSTQIIQAVPDLPPLIDEAQVLEAAPDLPTIDEYAEKEEILDSEVASWLLEEELEVVPQFAQPSNENSNSNGVNVTSLPDWSIVENEMSEALYQSRKKDLIFESSSADVVSQFGNQFEKEDDIMRLFDFDQFGDSSSNYWPDQEVADFSPLFSYC